MKWLLTRVSPYKPVLDFGDMKILIQIIYRVLVSLRAVAIDDDDRGDAKLNKKNLRFLGLRLNINICNAALYCPF